MADQIVGVINQTGLGTLKVDTSELVVGVNTVERQRMVIGDPVGAGLLANVTAGGALKVDASATTQPVSGAFYQATQPVSLAASVAVTGTFWQATQPVSGTFYQATQPISAASLPLPALAATSTLQSTINTTLGSPFQAGASIGNTSFIATQATAANLNATVTGSVTANAGTNLNTSALATSANLTAGTQQTQITDGTRVGTVKAASTASVATDTALVVAISPNNTVPVSGTFYQGTQPVSIAASVAVTGTFWQATQPVSGTFFQSVQPVSQATLTKGTQGANGVTVQQLHDAGRNATTFFTAVPIITTATDALLSLTGYKGGVAVTATTTPAVVTAAKTFRLSFIVITYVAVSTAGSTKLTLRANLSGTVVIGSPAVCSWIVGAPAAVAGVSQTVQIDIPEGLEFAAGTGIGISQQGLSAVQAAAAVGYGAITLHGYEY